MNTKSKIMQLMPVNDIWIRYKEDDETYFYDKAICLALIEWWDGHNRTFYQGLLYLCRCDVEFLDIGGQQNTQDILFTHDLPKDFNVQFR